MGFALFGVPISQKESARNFQRAVEVGLFNAVFLRSSCQAHALVDQHSCRFARMLQGLGKLVAEHDLLHALFRTHATGCEMIVLRGWRKVGNSINLRPVLLRNFDCSIICRVQHVDGMPRHKGRIDKIRVGPGWSKALACRTQRLQNLVPFRQRLGESIVRKQVPERRDPECTTSQTFQCREALRFLLAK